MISGEQELISTSPPQLQKCWYLGERMRTLFKLYAMYNLS